MYTPAFCLLAIGTVLLILNIILFFNDYKETIASPNKKKMLYVNGILITFSCSIVILSTIYVFMINNQLN